MMPSRRAWPLPWDWVPRALCLHSWPGPAHSGPASSSFTGAGVGLAKTWDLERLLCK